MQTTHSLTEKLLDQRRQSVPRGVPNTHAIFASRAEGARIWDVDGREYLDFTSGIGVMNVGHSHPRVIRAVEEQLRHFTHTCFPVVMYEPYVELAEKLSALVGSAGEYQTLFVTTGVEAIENAVKIARAYTKRPAIVAFTGGFHGRTLLGLTLTASSTGYRQNFGPFAPEVYHIPFPYEYRGGTTQRSLDALSELFDTTVPAENIAAVIIEPQLGEGGFVPAPLDFLRELRRITRERGILLIADEIQTGFGRTGKMFAFQHAGIDPDLVAMAKSLAAGLPLSAVAGRKEVMDAPAPGGLGGTYGGNPLACAAGLAVLSIFEEERLVERAARLGGQLREGLLKLQTRWPQIGDVRGLGAMLAIELVRDRDARTPDAALTQKILDRGRELGLLLLKCGPLKNVVRFLPPLITSLEEAQRALAILDKAFEQAV
ncbi:MAG TPA: 4-aminobutyrate--2-oxoglutarate transaminase [Bryobacteraceae bacterium]|nr:4-aminobutyrate--2-oxoglutarate transaminase [Bryobacteraceae bacterium]